MLPTPSACNKALFLLAQFLSRLELNDVFLVGGLNWVVYPHLMYFSMIQVLEKLVKYWKLSLCLNLENMLSQN